MSGLSEFLGILQFASQAKDYILGLVKLDLGSDSLQNIFLIIWSNLGQFYHLLSGDLLYPAEGSLQKPNTRIFNLGEIELFKIICLNSQLATGSEVIGHFG